MPDFTTPHSLPRPLSSDTIRGDVSDNLRLDIVALANASNTALTTEGARAESAAKAAAAADASAKDVPIAAQASSAVSTANNALAVSSGASSDADNAVDRVTALESAAGFGPSTPTDGTMADYIANPASLTASALGATIDGQVSPVAARVSSIHESAAFAADYLPAGWVSGDLDGGVIAAITANGGHVILPPGRIVAQQTIQPTKTLTLEAAGASLHGPGSSPTTLEPVADKDGIVLGSAAENSVIRGVNISSQAIKTGNTRGIVIDAGRVNLDNISVTRFGSHGIHVMPTSGNPHVISTSGTVSVRDNGGNGLHITGQSNACTFGGLDIGLNMGWGIWNEGRANVFMHPHILSNALGAIYDNGIGNAYIFPYVEADVNLVTDKIEMGPNSTGGFWLAGSYGKNEPNITATGGGLWTVITPQRMRRSLTIGAPLGKGTGKATVFEQGVASADMGRLRMENADGSVGVSLMRWSETLLESMIEHRFVSGLRIGDSVGPVIKSGTGSPEGVVSARPGSTYHRIDGTAGASFYIKDSGLSTTGWRAL